jgi:hypothetical protein
MVESISRNEKLPQLCPPLANGTIGFVGNRSPAAASLVVDDSMYHDVHNEKLDRE